MDMIFRHMRREGNMSMAHLSDTLIAKIDVYHGKAISEIFETNFSDCLVSARTIVSLMVDLGILSVTESEELLQIITSDWSKEHAYNVYKKMEECHKSKMAKLHLDK